MPLSLIPAGVIVAVTNKCAEVVNANHSAVTHVWGYADKPDHNNRRCIDFMVRSAADGDKVAAYLIAHAKRLGVAGIIWNRRVMGFPSNSDAYRGPEGQWRAYTGSSPHTDHVHVEFNAGGYKPAPAGGGGPAPSRPAVSLAAVIKAARLDGPRPQGGTTPGSADDVRHVERALRAEGLLPAAYAADGSFGTSTVKAYAAWQRRCGYSGAGADGIPGRASLTKLGNKHGFTVTN